MVVQPFKCNLILPQNPNPNPGMGKLWPLGPYVALFNPACCTHIHFFLIFFYHIKGGSPIYSIHLLLLRPLSQTCAPVIATPVKK